MHSDGISSLHLAGDRVCNETRDDMEIDSHGLGLDPSTITSFLGSGDVSICSIQFVIGLLSNVTLCTAKLLIEASMLKTYSPGISARVNLRSLPGCPILRLVILTGSVRTK